MKGDTFHNKTASQTLKALTSSERGLSLKDAKKRLKKYGPNALPTKKSDPWWVVLAQQFISPMIIILIGAAGISALLHEWVDVGVILAAVVINAIIGFIQEFKASRALESLKAMVHPTAIVLRDGKPTEVDASELVPGDILVLKAGDQLSADARIIESNDLATNEAALTGESLPVKKTDNKLPPGTLLADRSNMVYAGTTIVGGRGLAVITQTGTHTQIGTIAQLVQETKETSTPLQQQLSQLAQWLAILVSVLIAALFLIGLAKGKTPVEMFELSVALAVAAIPEGLIVAVTVILAIGMQRILKRRSLVRRLVAAETLGSVSVICTDKTGTITEGEMRVTTIYTQDEGQEELPHIINTRSTSVQQLLEIMVLCNDAQEIDGSIQGSPTERALLAASEVVGIDPTTLRNQHHRSAELPFDSAKKYMVTRNTWGEGESLLLKGAPSRVFAFSNLSASKREQLEQRIQEMTSNGLRLIAVAYKPVSQSSGAIKETELNDFTFLGFIGLRDPLRPEAREQIKAAKRAGVRTIIITGDHPGTARAIGAEAGLIAGPESIVIGSQLDEWTDAELARRVSKISIYARVEPRHKIRIIHAWQERGEVVSMTGDGVNDAPALKAADIGVAVGSGTEVAKQASDLVLLDNNLGTITAAIEEGRVMFDNIRKTTVYLMADSFTEMVLIGGSLILGLPIPLLPAQILWINLVADSFPNAGLMLEPGEKDVMSLPPRSRKEPVLNREMVTLIFIIGVVTDIVLFMLYYWLLNLEHSIETIRSIMFAAVGIDSLLYIFAVKSFRKTIFRINPFSNLYLVGGVLIGFGLMLLALLHPFFQRIFEIVPLSLSDWILLVMIGMIKLIAIEIVKEVFIKRKTT